MKRKVTKKPEDIKCAICEIKISAYGLPSHIKNIHSIQIEDYVRIYGEFRKLKPQSNRVINQIKCGICSRVISSVGMFVHLRDSHQMKPDEYVRHYPEYRPSQLRKQSYDERLETSFQPQTCVICNVSFASGNLLGWHVKNEHKLTKQEYIINHFFKGIHPTCLCGCGKKVKLLKYHPFKRDYISSHNPNPMKDRRHSNISKELMSLKAIERLSQISSSKIDTDIELEFASFLKKNNIKYTHPYSIPDGLVDFYLPDYDLLVEIDGSYWHPKIVENLNFRLLPNIISTQRKKTFTNLVRIRDEDIPKLKTIDDIKTLNTVYDFSIPYRRKIISKEFFEACLERKGKYYLKSNVWLLLKFLRELHPEFPYPSSGELPSEIQQNINDTDFDTIFDPKTLTFSNNISNIGVESLKSIFKSFWKSSFKGNPSPVKAWDDDNILKQVIAYRIGYNNSGEVFDFSLHQIIRGLSARRLTVSFFKPLLAAAIYKHYIGVKNTPVVFDPCCGFGGRLLGFKSTYPNGKYIGCEPNPETYQELLKVIEIFDLTNVEIHNCKLEDFSEPIATDLIFTSIPYYDLETYSNPTEYRSFEHWKETFIKSLLRYSKIAPTFINLPYELSQKLNWSVVDAYIASNRSHFDRKEGFKIEPIILLN